MQFINVRLFVSNIQASVAFWRDVIGLHLTYQDEAMGYAYFETSSAGVELLTHDALAATFGKPVPPPTPGGYPATLVFRVENVQTAYAQFIERGAQSASPPEARQALQMYSAHISDPDGYLIEIYCPFSEADTSTT